MYRPLVVLILLTVSACSSDEEGGPNDEEGGPIDARWTLTETSCNGATAQFPPYVLDIMGDVGTFELSFSAECVALFDESYRYTDSTIEIIPESITCDPNSGCMEAVGASCPMLPSPIVYEFSQTGDTLEFTKISGGPPGDPCPQGEEVKFVMSR